MKTQISFYIRIVSCFCVLSLFSLPAAAQTLDDIKQAGVLRHLGVKYANFVTGSGDGMDVELMRSFADYLGVEYQYVETTWADVIADLTGKRVKANGDTVEILGDTPIKGDVISNGFTVLPWRGEIVDYSDPVFPTQVWVIAEAESPLTPIVPSGNLEEDIAAVKSQLNSMSVLGKENTCLDPKLYALSETGAQTLLFEGGLNELAPAVINKDAQSAILDVPDALVALEKFPGQIKVIGPVSEAQHMATAFRKDSPELRKEFNIFLNQLKEDGSYLKLVQKYYPAVFDYYADFFKEAQ